MRYLLAIWTMLALLGADMVPAAAAEHGGGGPNGGGLSSGNSDAGGASVNSATGGLGMAPVPLPPLPPDPGGGVFKQRRAFGGFADPQARAPLPPMPGPAPYPPAQYPPAYRAPGIVAPSGDAPNRVMTDTRDYCLVMADEVEQAAARRPVLPPDIRVLAITGRRMCEHNLIMGGLQRLRIAWRLLATSR